MDAAVATLQMAARQLQLSGGLERCEYSRIMTRLREVTDELSAVERRTGKQKPDPVDFTVILRAALATASPLVDRHQSGFALSLPEGIMVEGPSHDLRDLLCSLFEYALSVGRDPIDLRVEVGCRHSKGREMCATELAVESSDLPDFLRRKLWDAIRMRRGEVSITAEPARCRIGFTLPIERRRAAEPTGGQ